MMPYSARAANDLEAWRRLNECINDARIYGETSISQSPEMRAHREKKIAGYIDALEFLTSRRSQEPEQTPNRIPPTTTTDCGAWPSVPCTCKHHVK